MSRRGGSRAPLFAAVVLFVALWPLAHRGLALGWQIDPWKLGGFAMYTTYQTSLVVFFHAGSGGLRPVDESTLPDDVRAELERFRARRSALGAWVAPDAAARALHAARPELSSLVVVVQRLWLDPETARIASEKTTYTYADGERFDLQARFAPEGPPGMLGWVFDAPSDFPTRSFWPCEELPMSQIPIHEGLFTWPAAEPRLLGSRCKACAEVGFPAQRSCPACTGTETEEIPLSPRGTLWTWTIQRFPPPAPPFVGDRDSFEPFGVGYVELPEGVRVEARLTENDPEKLAIGMEMELVVEKFDEDADGNERMIFAFRPA